MTDQNTPNEALFALRAENEKLHARLLSMSDQFLEDAHDLADAQREVEALNEQLEQTRLAERARSAQYDYEFASAFLDVMAMGSPKGELAEVRDYVALHRGTPEATARAKGRLLKLLDNWTQNSKAAYDNLKSSIEEKVTVWDARITQGLADVASIERLVLPQTEQLGKARGLRISLKLNVGMHAAMYFETEREALATAKMALEADVPPAVALAALRALLMARDAVGNNLHYVTDAGKTLDGMLSKVEGLVQAEKDRAALVEAAEKARLDEQTRSAAVANDGSETAVSDLWRQDDDNHLVDVRSYYAEPEPAYVPDDDYYDQYDYHPTINFSTGLPMAQGSMFDVAGNAYGTGHFGGF